jgi:hypothetical protein
MSNSLKEILKSDSFSSWQLSKEEKKKLDRQGFYLVKPNQLFEKWMKKDVHQIRLVIDELIKKEGMSAGSEGKEEFTINKNKKIENGASRLGNLLNKDLIFAKIATLPILINAAHHVISSEIKLSSILFREPEKNGNAQEIHIDWHARRNNKDKYDSLVSFFYIDDSTKRNGATIIIPGSHKKFGYPCEHVNPHKKHPDELVVEAPAGSLLILNANTWHKGGNNYSGEKRGMIAIEYRQRKLKQLLNLKKYIDEEKKDKFLPYEKYLFGLRSIDTHQIENSYGPGEKYKKWLKINKQYSY